MRYSKFSIDSPVYDLVKRFNETSFNEFAGSLMYNIHRNQEGITMHDAFISLMSVYQHKFCKSKHYFLDKGVMEFCYTSVKGRQVL